MPNSPAEDPRSASSGSPFIGRLFLASLSLYGNLPYRRLCVDFGAQGTISEMIRADQLVKGGRRDLPLLRHHPAETFFGAQLLGRDAQLLADAAAFAETQGVNFIDLNMACPIRVVVNRGAGAALLQRPNRIREIVQAVVSAVRIPITVKLRAGWSEDRPNLPETCAAAIDGGAAALFIHPRSRLQHYRRPANWELVREAVARSSVPVIGNGDIYHPEEAAAALARSGCAALAIGRGALHKPWLFQEIRENRDLDPSADERLELLRRYVRYAAEHFGDDALGKRRTRWFLRQHMNFLCRYMPLGAVPYRQYLQTRPPGLETPRSPLEAMMARRDLAAFEELCDLAGLVGVSDNKPMAAALEDYSSADDDE